MVDVDSNKNQALKSIPSITSTGRTEVVYLAGAAGCFVQVDVTVLSAVTACTIKLQGSDTGNPGSFNDVADSSQTVTASGTKSWSLPVRFNYISIVYAMSGGEISAAQLVRGRKF
jgi:hypothetical protein